MVLVGMYYVSGAYFLISLNLKQLHTSSHFAIVLAQLAAVVLPPGVLSWRRNERLKSTFINNLSSHTKPAADVTDKREVVEFGKIFFWRRKAFSFLSLFAWFSAFCGSSNVAGNYNNDVSLTIC